MQPLVWIAVGVLAGVFLAALFGRRAHPPADPADPRSSARELEATLAKIGRWEKAAIERLVQRGAPPDPNAAFERQLTVGERLADKVAQFGGSWTFIGLFLFMMAVWMTVNVLEHKPFDPYPFILLNLLLSCVASLQAPVIMMSQNRQAEKDRLMASHDYEVNLRAEMEIQTLHARFDQLREQDWAALVVMQQRQLELLECIMRDMGNAKRSGSEGGESA
jgi:uncharacterized membrane protein